MPKNIVIFSDGTGQEGGKAHNTNVYKLFNMVEDRTSQQVVFYDRGLGTGWRKITGNGAGAGISKNIKECYRFIFENFCSGDQIYLFGFSRGAATLRSLSGFIHLFGILPKSRPELIDQAYQIYKIHNRERREQMARDFVDRHHTMWTKIKLIGVWDTVSALGLPLDWLNNIINKIPFMCHRFHDFTLSDSVENAYHALAIDDERLTFHPLLWEPGIKSYQYMQQVWFAGMHTDVGGGYPEQALSDIALEWMVGKACRHGLRLYPHHKVSITPNAEGLMHNSRGSWFTRLFRKKCRSWDHTRYGPPCVHESALLRKNNCHNTANPGYRPWILQQEHTVEA